MKNIDKASLANAYRLFESGDINKIEIGKTQGLNKSTFTCLKVYTILQGKLESKTYPKEAFVLLMLCGSVEALAKIEQMPQSTFEEIIAEVY